MIDQKPKLAFAMTMAAAILILVNVLLIGINGGPLVVWSGAILSPNDAIGTSSNASLFRVALGLWGWVEGAWTVAWLLTSMVMLYLVLRLYIKPMERKTLCLAIVVLSALSLVYGGGFLIGALLGVLGAGIGYAWPGKPENAFFYKILRAARLDPLFYQKIPENEDSLRHGVYALSLASILSGIGVGIYSLATQTVLGASSTATPFRILLLGEMPLDLSIATSTVINLGLSIFKWLVLSIVIYVIAVQLVERKQKFSNIAAAVGFAYIPISLQFFMPFFLASQSGLGFTLPFYVFLATNGWMILALIVGIRQNLEATLGKTLGVLSISGAIYLLLHETFFAALEAPNTIRFAIEPQSALLVVVSSLVLASLLFETYTRH